MLLLAERAAAKLPAADADGADSDGADSDGADSLDENRDRIGEGWSETFAKQAETVGAAWTEPSAWEGTTRFAGGQVPASLAGSLVFADLVVHGWDLAKATGQAFHCDDDVAGAAYRLIAQMAEQGRTMGALGEEVAVPETASLLDRALGLSGRHPHWSPG